MKNVLLHARAFWFKGADEGGRAGLINQRVQIRNDNKASTESARSETWEAEDDATVWLYTCHSEVYGDTPFSFNQKDLSEHLPLQWLDKASIAV